DKISNIYQRMSKFAFPHHPNIGATLPFSRFWREEKEIGICADEQKKETVCAKPSPFGLSYLL
ncbi:MAG: hypothetical protein J6R42_05830, partial [Clostridia bacterium]|nr:hypothetical protein [Clostridia bacterium]